MEGNGNTVLVKCDAVKNKVMAKGKVRYVP